MSEVYIKWNVIQKNAVQIENSATKFINIYSKMNGVISGLAGMSGYGNITAVIKNARTSAESEAKIIKSMGDKLGQVAEWYKSTEEKLAGTNVGLNNNKKNSLVWKNGQDSSGAGKKDTEDASDSLVSWGDAWDLISSFGVGGKSVATVGGIISGTWKGETGDVINSISNAISGFGDLAVNAFKEKEQLNLKELLFGTNADENIAKAVSNNGKISVSGAMKNYLKDTLDGMKISTTEMVDGVKTSTVKSVGEKIKVGTNWAGTVLTAVGNGVENYEEFEGDMNVRFWGETVVETAVDIGVGILAGAAATAAVAAGAAAVGATAPVWLVGAATVGVAWGANSLCKLFSKDEKGKGRDLGETASDLLFDGLGGWISDVVN